MVIIKYGYYDIPILVMVILWFYDFYDCCGYIMLYYVILIVILLWFCVFFFL